MKIKTGIVIKHRKPLETEIFFDVPLFYPEEKRFFTLEEMKEIVKEMEKMELERY